MPRTPFGTTIEEEAGVGVLLGDPRLNFRTAAILEPAVRVGNLHTVEDIDDRFAAGRRRAHGRVRTRQPRPQLGFLPWFALLRRILALRFFVFFDMGDNLTLCQQAFPR
jgi:hypothetical protein